MLYRQCRKKGLTIRSTVDLLIAQTDIDNRATLLHNDRNFEAIAIGSLLRLYSLPRTP
jgi:predicted nucleic acid-binding protein